MIEDDDFRVKMPKGALSFGSLTGGDWNLEDMQRPRWGNKRMTTIKQLLKPRRHHSRGRMPDYFYKAMSVFDDPDFPFVHKR